MDDQRLQRIEDKFDKFYDDFRDFKENICIRVQKLEVDMKLIQDCNNKQNEEIKPFSNFRWLLLQIPSIVAVVASLIAIVKVLGKVP